jgi:hypothetical protein
MTTLKAFITKHEVLMYLVLAFTISWGGLLLVGGFKGLSGTDWQSDPRLPLLVVAMLAGPSIAALLMTAVVSGRAGLHQLISRLLRWRVRARWYAVALLTAPLVFATVHLALSVASPVFVPRVLSTGNVGRQLLSSIAGALLVGLFEEIG